MVTPLQSYLLAEVLRHVEEQAGTPQLAPDAAKQAIADGLTFPDRILTRAAILAPEQGLARSVQQAGNRIRMVVLGFIALCCILGIGATYALPEGFPARANVVSLLALLLVPNLLSLLVWLVVTLRGLLRRGKNLANGWLGRQLLGFYLLLEGLLNVDTGMRAAGRAWRDYLTLTASGRRLLVVISHACWIALLFGALSGSWWLLVVRQVDFVWGSTLLTTADVQSLLGALTRWVAGFGFAVPSQDDIAASRIDTTFYNADLRRNWGIFILGAIVSMAILPRLIAMTLDLIGYWHAGKNLQLDLTHPGYARLQSVLLPLSHEHALIDPDTGPPREVDRPSGISALSPDIPRNAAWLALEQAPALPYPAGDIQFDLGVLASYGDMNNIIKKLTMKSPGWRAVCIHADLAITPDQGIARLLLKLVAASTRPLHLVLAVSPRAAALPVADLKARREDWLRLAVHAGLTVERLHQYAS